MNKPTIDEQLEYLNQFHKSGAIDAILASLERLKRLDSGEPVPQHRWGLDGERCEICGDKDWMGGPCISQPVPVEPEWVKETRKDLNDNIRPNVYIKQAYHDYVALQSALQVSLAAQAMLKGELGMAWTERNIERDRAEKAESALQAAQQERDKFRAESEAMDAVFSCCCDSIGKQVQPAFLPDEIDDLLSRNKRMVELLKAILGAMSHPTPPNAKDWEGIKTLSAELLKEVGNAHTPE